MNFNVKDPRNLSMLIDYYELTMSNGYLENGIADRIAVFDMFFRKIPDGGGFAIFAGLEQFITYINNLSFTEEDIAYLRGKHEFGEKFLNYLRDFHFTCDIWAVEEGTPIFPNEPILTVRGPVVQAQLVETMALLTLNHQSLVATKASRIARAAAGRPVFEFGSRRAQSYDAAVLGARASYIGGCSATACALADRDFGVPAVGTMAHSWVQVFDSEYEAFSKYAQLYPHNCTLLVDTYNTLRSGVPNAIRVFNEVVLPAGHRPKGIRIDSGDIAYLSKKARILLDEAGFQDVKIVASNSLDEYIIRDLMLQGAKVDSFGVGENLITSKSDPVFGGVYKLVAIEERDGTIKPRIKISESVEKITTPCHKSLYRFYGRDNGKALADYVTVFGEEVDDSGEFTIFDPTATWKKKKVYNFYARPLHQQIFNQGAQCYQTPPLENIRTYCASQVDALWDEVKRFENPHSYYVDLSLKLWTIKQEILESFSL